MAVREGGSYAAPSAPPSHGDTLAAGAREKQDPYDAGMLRLGSCVRPAGGSPVRVSAGAPGSRPRLEGETLRVERGVESLFGGSKRAGCDCSLVTFTTEEPSRSCHGEG